MMRPKRIHYAVRLVEKSQSRKESIPFLIEPAGGLDLPPGMAIFLFKI